MNRDEWEQHSYLAGVNAPYVEALYESYLQDPNSIEPQWQQYFSQLKGNGAAADVSHETIRHELREQAKKWRQSGGVATVASGDQGIEALKSAYRRYGHYSAHINPLHESAPALDAHLEPSRYGVDASAEANMITQLQKIYCGSTGFEYAHIDDDTERDWLQQKIETDFMNVTFSAEQQKKLLYQLVSADTLEKYLDVKYVGQKRFSAEGIDALIPLLRETTERAAEKGVHQLVFAMAHRGRLNVLINVMGRSSDKLFTEFDGAYEEGMTSGDVKYHRGFSSDAVTPAGDVHLSLMFNPSHLEFINPVAMGSVRARQDHHESGLDYAMPVIIHGDGAFAGQGVVMETLSMSQTRAYTVGGSLHIIANNQIGFTTSDPRDTRSSHYCSDMAKMIAAPIFHVNADDAEAVVKVTRLAFDYRVKFHKDVFIDLVGYRRHGHQEVDEPRATQPMMYKIIKERPVAAKLYADQLIRQGIISDADYTQMIAQYRSLLEEGKRVIETKKGGLVSKHEQLWSTHMHREWQEDHSTTLDHHLIETLAEKMTQQPESMVLHRNIDRLVSARRNMGKGEQPIDWGFGEMMAYASLLHEGFDVRLTGEDVRRGTFYHRHARQLNQETGEEVMPLAAIAQESGALLSIYDSLLSEIGTMGFEYGYSTADPRGLVMWEAQFGDFANASQVIIDQFISSGWQKWNRLSGLVLLLPHGYEAMGPEHSSARLERYLQLCAQDNMQVCVPTTPAQMFHLLRRQVIRLHRSPLIVLTPKSLLRHKLATSTLNDLVTGSFKTIIPEIDDIEATQVTRVIMCTGKIYYELLEKRRALERHDVAIIRIEQLYPFPYDKLREQLIQYEHVKMIVWCQEEPKNQGTWFWIRDRFAKLLQENSVLAYAGRAASAAPACGYASLHKHQQDALVEKAFSDDFNDKELIKF
ncbi:MAG: 2-oxoglutarate dehydrogenase E1 component [Coxiella sp. (in: Bacteria)]|nr:MAG: 2-oxoglutarate dehydrogenase E1 component [Coxiella sp. (in: g-proteobacteria)]